MAGPNIAIADLIEYTDWERAKWLDWLRQQHGSGLKADLGSHANARFACVGDTVRHIFSAEKRYIDRLSNRAITETSSIPTQDLEALFAFGQQSRADLKSFIATFPPDDWERPLEMKILDWSISASTRKIVTHILMHEIRHWAQISTTLRMNGLKPEFHDFLFSPALGGEVSGG